MTTALKKLRDSQGQDPENPFKAFGFDYRYVADGNDLESMINAFSEIRYVDHPLVLHINTLKGKGYQPAIEDEEKHHWVRPFNLSDDSSKSITEGSTPAEIAIKTVASAIDGGQENIMRSLPLSLASLALTPLKSLTRTTTWTSGSPSRIPWPSRRALPRPAASQSFLKTPPFLQRAFDQLSHDVAANNLPVVMIVAGGGIQANSKTHVASLTRSWSATCLTGSTWPRPA